MKENTPEQRLKMMVPKLEPNYMRRDAFRRGRLKSPTENYSHIYQSLVNLSKVIKLILRCYHNYPRVYKRLGPESKNGGLLVFLERVRQIKCLFEELLTEHLKPSLPRTFPSELVNLILKFSVAGKRKLDVGFYSHRQLDQICEGIERRKFLTLCNTLSVSLLNSIFYNKMELGGFTIESQMECFCKDVRAFQELSDQNTLQKDFSRFSKIDLPHNRRRRSPLQQYKHSIMPGSASRKIYRRPNSVAHDFTVYLL